MSTNLGAVHIAMLPDRAFFIGLGVDVVLFQEHQPDVFMIAVLVQGKTIFCISGHPGHRIEHYHISGSQNPVELQPFRAKNRCPGVGFLCNVGSWLFDPDVANLAVDTLFCSGNSAIAINAHNFFLSVSKMP